MPLWTPAKVPLSFWFDGADTSTFTLDGSGNVEVLGDKSGNGRHLSQATPAHRFIPEAGALKSDGNRFMVADGLTGIGTLSNASLIMVGQYKTQVSTDYLATLNASAPTNGRFFPGFWSGNEYVWRHGDLTIIAEVPQDPTKRHIFAMIADAGQVIALHDGHLVGSTTTASSAALDEIRLGGTPSQSRLNGDFCEAIGMAAGASLDDLQKIKGYLAHKWGLAAKLPADHPYKSAPPVYGVLHGTVIGKDGNPAERRISVLDAYGQCVATDTSDPLTGAYELELPSDAACTLVFDGESDRDPLAYANVIPDGGPA